MESPQYLKVLREKVLSDCRPDLALWTCHGTIIRNVYELASNIEVMSDYSFRYHVNEDNQKNDFAVWIREVLQDVELSERLRNIMDRAEYLEIIQNRIFELENANSQ